jgi:hypothetical protein
VKFTHFMPDIGSEHSSFPITAKSQIPQWYKDGETTYTLDGKNQMPGLKACVPVLDALMSGYLVTTSTDIYIVKNKNKTISIDFDKDLNGHEPVAVRPEQLGATIPRPAGHLSDHLVWCSNWGWKTPRGYSMLVTHPLNRWDLPFTTMSAIVDSDKFHGPGNMPFFLKEDFEGIIPKGTPYLQLIPIKRKDWTAVLDPALIDLSKESGRTGSRGGYKKNMWQKKTYLIGGKNGKK